MKKFFDSVDQTILLKILSRRIKDNTTYTLLKEIIRSYTTVRERKMGMPIGNLTSQIFANIYLNELDRFVKHQMKAKAYLRYGDDFIIVENDPRKLKCIRNETTKFLATELKLETNPKSDKMIKASHALKFLGVRLWPNGRTLNKRSFCRAEKRLKINNISSYGGIIKKHTNAKRVKHFTWLVYEKLLENL